MFEQAPPPTSTLYHDFTQAVAANINAKIGQGDKALYSRRIGAEVLDNIGTGWHGQFNRAFPNMETPDKASIVGMEIYNFLATLQGSDWLICEDPDPSG